MAGRPAVVHYRQRNAEPSPAAPTGLPPSGRRKQLPPSTQIPACSYKILLSNPVGSKKNCNTSVQITTCKEQQCKELLYINLRRWFIHVAKMIKWPCYKPKTRQESWQSQQRLPSHVLCNVTMAQGKYKTLDKINGNSV
jgi:hypothetical protein